MVWAIDPAMIEAAASALWLRASKDRFGPWGEVHEAVKRLWREDASAALEAALNAVTVGRT